MEAPESALVVSCRSISRIVAIILNSSPVGFALTEAAHTVVRSLHRLPVIRLPAGHKVEIFECGEADHDSCTIIYGRAAWWTLLLEKSRNKMHDVILTTGNSYFIYMDFLWKRAGTRCMTSFSRQVTSRLGLRSTTEIIAAALPLPASVWSLAYQQHASNAVRPPLALPLSTSSERPQRVYIQGKCDSRICTLSYDHLEDQLALYCLESVPRRILRRPARRQH